MFVYGGVGDWRLLRISHLQFVFFVRFVFEGTVSRFVEQRSAVVVGTVLEEEEKKKRKGGKLYMEG